MRGIRSWRGELLTAELSEPLRPILPRSRHLPVAITDGSLTENFNKNGVRLWTDRSGRV